MTSNTAKFRIYVSHRSENGDDRSGRDGRDDPCILPIEFPIRLQNRIARVNRGQGDLVLEVADVAIQDATTAAAVSGVPRVTERRRRHLTPPKKKNNLS